MTGLHRAEPDENRLVQREGTDPSGGLLGARTIYVGLGLLRM